MLASHVDCLLGTLFHGYFYPAIDQRPGAGSVYALVALGYTMVYGILELINFAHGEVVMIGAMVALAVINALLGAGVDLPGLAVASLGLLAAIPVCALLGFSIERIAYGRCARPPRLAPLITAIGVSIVLQNVAMMVWASSIFPFPPSSPPSAIRSGAPPSPISSSYFPAFLRCHGRALVAGAENPARPRHARHRPVP